MVAEEITYYVKTYRRLRCCIKYCPLVTSMIPPIIFGLYFFDIVGSTKFDCYYIEGNINPMTLKTASEVASKEKNGPSPINVTKNFDKVIFLSFYSSLCVLVTILSLYLLKSCICLKKCIGGYVGWAGLIMTIIQFGYVIMIRGTYQGAVCSGRYIISDLSPY